MANHRATHPKPDPIECPRCGRVTGLLPVEVDRIDWAGFLLLGFWALLLPSVRGTALQCRNCGKQFRTKRYEMTAGDRIIRGVFCAFLIVMAGAMLVLFWPLFGSGS